MASSQQQHVVLFPFMTQGHLIPFMALARHLEQKTNFIITILNTPLNILALRSSLPSRSTIRLVALPFNSQDHGLPPDSETFDTLNPHLYIRLCESSRSLKPSFDQFISMMAQENGGCPPLCIISNVFLSWTVDIANQLHIFHTIFLTNSAFGIATLFSLWLNLPHTWTSSDEFVLPDFPEAGAFRRSQLATILKQANGSDSWSRFIQEVFTLSLRTGGFLCNTVEELDQTGLQYLRRKTNRPVWPIGPVKIGASGRKPPSLGSDSCISWLNQYIPSSVLFVCFGSLGHISATEMMELAIGLEESRKAFIWVVRAPLGFDVNEEFRPEWLPEGFEDRVMGRKQGLLVRKWAPQLEILCHASTGAFLSHCGWNSVVESLSCGVPIIGWPIGAEQFYNSKLLEEEMGVCVEIARGDSFTEIEKGKVKEVIEMVMGGNEKGKKMKEKALEIKEKIEAATRDNEELKGSSVKATEAFLETALATRVKQH